MLSVFIWMLHMFQIYVACVLFGCCVWLSWFSSVFQVFFSSVSEACFKYFNCLQTYVATVVFECFKSRSDVASLLPTFYCKVSLGPDRASIRCHGRILLNRRHHAPFPSCRSGGAGLACSTKRAWCYTTLREAYRGSTPEMAARWWDGDVEEICCG
jgi:hypothetical protein